MYVTRCVDEADVRALTIPIAAGIGEVMELHLGGVE